MPRSVGRIYFRRKRFRLQVSRKIVAKAAADGNPEPETQPFLTETIVSLGKIEDYRPGAIKRFTIVMWLEGDDPECTDDIIGGSVSFGMNFTVLSAE